MTQTAEGALGEVENILQRIRELSVQASNSTLDGNDRDMIQNEVTALLSEIDKIASTTDFNGTKLLNGSKDQVHFQIGINASDALAVDLQKSDITLGLGGTSGVRTITSNRVAKTDYNSANLAKTDIKINGENMLSANYTVDLSSASNAAGLMATAINLNTVVHGAVADAFNTVTSKPKGDFKMTTTFAVNQPQLI